MFMKRIDHTPNCVTAYWCTSSPDRLAVNGSVLAVQLSRRVHHVLCENFGRRSQPGDGQNNLHLATGRDEIRNEATLCTCAGHVDV